MDSTKPQVVFAEHYDQAAIDRVRASAEVTVLQSCNEDSLKAAVRDCDALLVRTYARVTEEIIASAPKLRVIGRGGVGLENIDLDAARRRSITVVYRPAAATEAVAELTVGLIIALTRQIFHADHLVRAGRFAEGRALDRPLELSEMTVGIIGLGRIGNAVGRRCRHGFGARILYNDIVNPGLLDFVAEPVQKEQLYAESDVVSLHVPLTPETHHLINAHTLGLFKTGAFLINTARGPVVDNGALAAALSAGRLAGAALDVYDPEPLPPDHPLLHLPGTILTPHCAARTARGLARMNEVVEDVLAILQGKEPQYPA